MQAQISSNLFDRKVSAGVPFGIKDSKLGAGASILSLARAADRVYLAEKFVATHTYTLTQAGIWLAKVLNPVFTVKVLLFSHNSGANTPNAQIGTASTPIAASTFSPSPVFTEQFFSGTLSVPIVLGTTYWVVLLASGSSGTNYTTVRGSSVVGGRLLNSADAVTWLTANGTTVALDFALFG